MLSLLSKNCVHVICSLSLNIIKTKCLFIGTWHKVLLLSSDSDTCLDGHSIERIESYHGLGIQVDETLSWDPLISEVKRKVSKVLAALSRL